MARLLALIFVLPALAREYAPECPCMDANTPGYAAAARRLVELGQPGYGMQGCQPYDKGLDWRSGGLAVACKGAGEDDVGKGYCFKYWCFVDAERCSVDAALCPRLGSSDGPHCRDRPKFYSALPGLESLLYSYQTCGDLDGYSHARSAHPHFPEMLERKVIRIAPLEGPPMVMQQPDGSWTGSLFELFKSAVAEFPGVELEVASPLVSPEAQEAVNGSLWTACVYDVGIGRLDACISDFWVTSERLQIANFLPSVYEEAHYFLMKTPRGDGLQDVLAKPFRPFTPELWGFIVAFLLLSGLMLAMAERRHNAADFPPEEPVTWHLARTAYYSIHAFVAGPVHSPSTDAGKLITLGLSFFVLIAMASYTANMASFLLADSRAESVTSFQEAVDEGYRFCVHTAMASRLRRTYPKLGARPGRVIEKTSSRECIGLLQEAGVDGIVLSEHAVDKMYAGVYVASDCADPWYDGTLRCPRSNGRPDPARDCNIVKVGEAPLRVSVSFPVDPALQQGLGWAMIKRVAEGALQGYELQFAPQSQAAKNACPKKDGASSSQSLGIVALVGTMLISFFLVLLGSGLALLNHGLRAWRARFMETAATPLGMESTESMDPKKTAELLSETAARFREDLKEARRAEDCSEHAGELQEAPGVLVTMEEGGPNEREPSKEGRLEGVLLEGNSPELGKGRAEKGHAADAGDCEVLGPGRVEL